MALSETPSPEQTPKQSDAISDAVRQFLAKLEPLPTPEEKIALGLQFLREAISQEGTPRFRDFWEGRRTLLPLFRQNINPAIRSRLWDEFVELTIEVRRLKEILEEQSAFAMEQIDLAIKALEDDIGQFDKLLASANGPDFPQQARMLSQKIGTYSEIQRELNLLNTLASRLNGLRKEIIKTEMRVRFKTKFFKRLSSLGDHIFPKRKQLIDKISAEFEGDVSQFADKHFKGEEAVGAPYYALRDEIKALQGFAKQLTLNTNVFTKTRLKLSECWDKVKVLEKAHKQELNQKKQVWSDNCSSIVAKITELKVKSVKTEENPGMDLKEVDAALDEIQKEMRDVDLGKDEVRQLRQEMSSVRAPFIEEQEAKRREVEQAERDKLQARKDKNAALKERIAQLSKDTVKTGDELSQDLEEIRSGIEELSLSKFEQQQFDRLLRPLKDQIADRKESALLSLDDDQREALGQLREVLKQRKSRRQEVKEQLETHRKMLSSSSLDFEKAMAVREQIDQEKERLEKANAGIEEVERKIAEIEENA